MQLKLRVSAGPTRENQTTLCVNDEAAPLLLRAPHWEGRVLVRVRDFRGVAPPGRPVLPWSPYFDGNSDQYSIQVQGRFLGGGLTADDVIFGNDFDRPLRLPPFSSVGLAVAKTIDPGLQADLFCDKPWAFSPFFVSVNTLNVVAAGARRAAAEDGAESGGAAGPPGLPAWPTLAGERLAEDTLSFLPVPLSASERRLYFAAEENRARAVLTENHVVSADFFNPYLDMNAVAIKLPGFSVSVMKYWDGQGLRYVCQTRDRSRVFFVVTFSLVEVADDPGGVPAGEGGEEEEEEGCAREEAGEEPASLCAGPGEIPRDAGSRAGSSEPARPPCESESARARCRRR